AERVPVLRRVSVAGGDPGGKAAVQAERDHLRAVFARGFHGSIRRAVVDDEHVGLRKLLSQLVEHGRKVPLLVPGGDEDERVAPGPRDQRRHAPSVIAPRLARRSIRPRLHHPDGGCRIPAGEQGQSVGWKEGVRSRAAVAAAITVLVLTALTASAAASPSEVAQSGTLTLTSDPGDFVGRGLTYSYATPQNVFFAVTRDWSGQDNMVNVTMRTDPSSTDYWMLDFAAPPGQTLTAGSYSAA